jgi:hypothetical protein
MLNTSVQSLRSLCLGGEENGAGGIQSAFWLWLGCLMNIAYQLVGCALAGAILAIWRPQETTAAAAQPAWAM